MSENLVKQRRAFLKKRFVSSIIQLSVVFVWTVYNCIAEIFFASSALPASFYIPQFVSALAKKNSASGVKFTLLIILAVAILIFLALCLVMSRKNYRFVGFLNFTVSADIVLLIYIVLQSLATKSFGISIVINLLFHIWLLVLVTRLRRACEGLEVLPDGDGE